MNYAQAIREIGRGRVGARDLSLKEAQHLYGCLLDDNVPELEAGAIAIALRMKGETANEMLGFLNASLERLCPLRRPATPLRPIVIPTYNGARKGANLTALLALLLQRFSIPVVIHGLTESPERVTTAQILHEFELMPCAHFTLAQQQLDNNGLVFIPLPILSPGLDHQLGLRQRLGLRNSAHSLVKMLDPFKGEGVLLAAATHLDYIDTMREVIGAVAGRALLFRGTEGEPFANPKRCPRIEYLHDKTCETLFAGEHDSLKALPDLPDACDAATTATWMRRVLAGKIAIPQPIINQLACCLVASGHTKDISQAVSIVASKRFDINTL